MCFIVGQNSDALVLKCNCVFLIIKKVKCANVISSWLTVVIFCSYYTTITILSQYLTDYFERNEYVHIFEVLYKRHKWKNN